MKSLLRATRIGRVLLRYRLDALLDDDGAGRVRSEVDTALSASGVSPPPRNDETSQINATTKITMTPMATARRRQ